MRRLLGWMRVGLSDLRGDLRRFGILIACLALGTGVIAAVGSVGAGFVQAVERDATTMMGGDLGAALSDREANADELAFLHTLGEITHVVDTTARGVAGENTVFLDLLAVDENYPLRGEVKSPQLSPGQKPGALLAEQEGVYGAIVDPVLLDRLDLDLGGRFFIGQSEFEIRGTLVSLPDSAVRGFQLGLTTLIPTEALERIGELRSPMPGLLTHYRYKIILAEMTYEEAAGAIAQRFDDEEWEIRSPREAAGDLVHFYDLFSRFLMIVGLSSLLVGGVGVSNGVSAYISERQRSIATLRSLGATGARILVHFLTQVGVLTLIGVALGVAFGAVASLILLPFVGNAININLPPIVDFPSLLTAAGFGVLAGFAFSYLPLMRAQKVSPALLFRSLGANMPQMDWRAMARPLVVVPILIAGGGIFWLAVITTNRFSLVAFYTLGVLASFVLLRGSGWLLQQGLKRVPPVPSASIRSALRNIYHPGSSAPVVIVSIGMGLAMLLVIALLNNNLQNQLRGAVSRDAPTFVALDLFPDEVEALKQLSEEDDDIVEFQSSAMLRGSVSKVNGIDAATLTDVGEEAMFLLSGEIPLTWVREMPPATTAIEGEWWPADYEGPQLISLRQTIKSQLGVKVGDTIQFKIFGDIVETKIANFREYEWQNGINFMVTFSPGVIETFPFNYLGTLKAAEGAEKTVERKLVRLFPDLSFIPIGDALNQVASVLARLGTAVNVVGGLAVINGLLVLAGTMAAGRKQRESEAIIQKVLGATRADILQVFVLEYGLLGAFAALIASGVGIFSAWAITESIMDIKFGVDPMLILLVIVGAVLLTIATGAATTWRALSSRPAQVLRNA